MCKKILNCGLVSALFLFFFCSEKGKINTLEAQETTKREAGWFVGVSPFSFISTIEMSSTGGQSSYITNIADATNINYTTGSTTSTTDSNVLDLLKQGALFLCGQNPSGQFQEIYGRTYAVDYSDLDDNGDIVFTAPPRCNLPSISSSISKADNFSGIGIQLGYNFDNWRLSFTNYSSQAGDNKLTNQLLMADLFFNSGIYFGVGMTSANLDSILGSESKTAAAVSFGYQYGILKNLKLELAYLFLNNEFSLQGLQEASLSNQATQNIKVQATRQLDDNYQIEAYYGNVEVKRITPTPTNIKIEVKKQSALVLKINYSF